MPVSFVEISSKKAEWQLALPVENARTIREILPREAWEEINSYYQSALDNKQSSFSRQGRHRYLEQIIANSQMLTGLLAGSMSMTRPTTSSIWGVSWSGPT